MSHILHRNLRQVPPTAVSANGIRIRDSAGRFFAEIQLEMMMAHIVTTYDVRTETPGVLPKSVEFGSIALPNMSAKVLFRERLRRE